MKNRYAYLDGLRGLAAIIIMIFHSNNMWGVYLPHGYLAVDVFFIMSGFVIASAYDTRLSTGDLSVVEFMKIRLVRLYPVFLLSFLVSIPLFLKQYLGEGVTTDGILFAATTAGLNLFMLPSYSPRTPLLFAVNIVYWSLFFELLTNAVFAFFHRFIKGRVLPLIIGLLGICLIGFGFRQGDLDYGAAWQEFAGGLIRSHFGILMGVALFRYRNKFGNILSWIPAPLVLTLACVPMLAPAVKLNQVVDLIAIFIVFPLTVLVLSKANSQKMTTPLLALGSASYPLYLFHFQAWQYAEIVLRHHPERFAPLAGAVTLALLIPVSILIERKVDEPIRRWLTSRLKLKGKPAVKAVGA